MHEQFEAIRARPALSAAALPSDYIDEHRKGYYELLQRLRTHGDWNAWIRYFLTGVERIARKAVQQSSTLIDIRERYRDALKDKARAAALLEELMMNPFITVLRAQKNLRVSNPTARKTVELLIERGIIAPLGDRRWGKVYVSKEILAAIEQK